MKNNIAAVSSMLRLQRIGAKLLVPVTKSWIAHDSWKGPSSRPIDVIEKIFFAARTDLFCSTCFSIQHLTKLPLYHHTAFLYPLYSLHDAILTEAQASAQALRKYSVDYD
jgi:hypothetical protein